MPVVVEDLPHMNLLGLFLRGLLERQLEDPVVARKLEGVRGHLGIQAAGMGLVLQFEGANVVMRMGEDLHARATVSGPMAPLVDILVGRYPLGAVLSRRIRVEGDLGFVWRVLPALRLSGGR